MKNQIRFSGLVLSSALILFLTTEEIHAQPQPFDKGDKNLNISIGMGTPWVLFNDYKTVLPPITASFDYGFRDDIGPGVLSLGGVIGATTYKDVGTIYTNWQYEYGYKSTTAIVALRSTYHYQIVNKIDTYGGIHLGMRVEKWSQYGNFPPYQESRDINFRPVFNIFGGAKYFFTDKIAAMLELGYGIAFINAGICLKL
jgi:hypothetical protein